MRLADTILVSVSGLVVLFLFGLVGTGSFSPFGILATSLLLTYSPQNGVILLVMAFLISPMGLPLAAEQGTEFEICDSGVGLWIKYARTQNARRCLSNHFIYCRDIFKKTANSRIGKGI